jgi:hypothetical protein
MTASDAESTITTASAGQDDSLAGGDPPTDNLIWRCIAASVRGVGHERSGQPCQDAHGWRCMGGKMLAASIADGAGSAALSEIGARIAADTALNAIVESIESALPSTDEQWSTALLAAAVAARTAVEAEAVLREIEVRELASTLILVAAHPSGIAVAQIGDGAAVVKNRAGELSAITIPQNGEYLNETIFLTSPTAVETAQVVVWRGEPAQIAVFSDGLQTIALSAKESAPYAPFFAPLFRFADGVTDQTRGELELAEFLKSPRFEQRTDDDLTLVLATIGDTVSRSG